VSLVKEISFAFKVPVSASHGLQGLACVANVNGEEEGEGERGRKMGDLG